MADKQISFYKIVNHMKN